MNVKLSKFITSLESLKKTIDSAAIHKTGFQAHGWNQVHLSKEHISYILSNYIEKLGACGELKIPDRLAGNLDNHSEKIDLLNTNSKKYFTNAAAHLLYSVPGILLTLQAIFSDIDYELFSYENIQDNKLLPKNLATRLRGVSAKLDSMDESSVDLKNKIGVINEAHEAAESLPTDLASLQDAKKEISNLINTASNDFSIAKKELLLLKEEAVILKNEVKKASEEVELLKAKATLSAEAASKLVDECDDALQITTTQGLAAGFDQKAKELKNSIWVWIIGLLIALSVGAFIGSDRVTAFTLALQSELSVGQAMLHTIMSIFSIGGPLWLAWISTQQINQRFKLSEDYSYKATVAKAFTGFSKFAERFDEKTSERLFNSTLDRLDEMPLRLIEGKDYNSPWHEFIDSESFKKAIDMVPSLAKEAGRFASNTKLKKKPKITPKNNPLAEVETLNNTSQEQSAS